jgi:hypothetical protein
MAHVRCGDSTGPDPLPPLSAHAGQDQDVAVSSVVRLDGTGSMSTGVTLTWTQLSGPPVGTLSGATPTFTAPADVSTLVFELAVSRGNDANPGSRAQPFASVQAAINAAHAADRRGDVSLAAHRPTIQGGNVVEGSGSNNLTL